MPKTEKKTAAKKAPGRAVNPSAEVDAFMSSLDHPLKPGIEALRAIILGADPRIGEGIKWNAPSFRTSKEWFATFHPRARDCVQLILHLGAKVKDNSSAGASIADESGLLIWLAKERATVKFASLGDIAANKAALQSIVRQWVELVGE